MSVEGTSDQPSANEARTDDEQTGTCGPFADQRLVLAERCEKAGPDRELDGEIYCSFKGVAWRFALTPAGEIADLVPAYTASLDAAMTLAGNHVGFHIMAEAIKRCSMFTENEEEFRRRLPAFVAAAALRAHKLPVGG